MIHSLSEAMEQAVRTLSSAAAKDVTLVHHNDTDGLSSGTILLSALEQSGYRTTRFSLEKPYPQVLESLLAREGGIIIFADFAGRIAPLISRTVAEYINAKRGQSLCFFPSLFQYLIFLTHDKLRRVWELLIFRL